MNRSILCLDGGGIRGIMTIQLLKKLEAVEGKACHELFDMVAGTSTGGIIAGLIALGKSAAEIEGLYDQLVRRVFQPRSRFANRFANPPQYSKAVYRTALEQIIGRDTTLEQCCRQTGTDLMITAKDVAEGEETFFSCFLADGPAPGATAATGTQPPECFGAYRSALLRAVMEATMSAPTYFNPLERFVDGGVTAYNNPVLAAIIEAVRYGPKGKYDASHLTVYSFGTGCRPQFVAPEQVADPAGVDVTFWLQWLMTEAGDDASDMQTYLLRTRGLFGGLDFRRFQVSLDSDAMGLLDPSGPPRPEALLEDVHETDAQRLRELTDAELAGIQLDNVRYFPVMKAVGRTMAEFIGDEAERRGLKPFGFDLVDGRGRELLVTRKGDVAGIARQMSDPDWLSRVKP